MNQPLVSIGIPTYNRPAGFRRVLEEIISQTYNNLEIIVSDNHSPEAETEQIAREFMQKDARIRYFKQEKNIGIFNNYQFLLAQAQGEYFAWMSDDDFRDLNYIEACIKEFDRLKTPILVNSYCVRLDAQSGKTIKIDRGCTTLGMPARDRYVKYLSTIFTIQAGVGDIFYGIAKRENLVKAMTDSPNIIGWDHIPLARLALDGEFYTIPIEMMGSSDSGASSSTEQTAKSQLITGSLSEKMPLWVREAHLQQTVWDSATLSGFEKLWLSIWSYSHYFINFGSKMWLKRLSPELHAILKKWFNPHRRSASMTH